MPSTSAKQHRFMAAVANNPKFAKKAGVPQSVGAEFMKADTGRKFKEGGEMKESKAMMKKEVGFMKKAGAPKSMIKHEEAEMKSMKTKKMNMGGVGYTPAKFDAGVAAANQAADAARYAGAPSKMRTSMMATGGITKAKMGKVPTAAPSRDGLATKGKTKGTMVKMAASKPLGMKRGGKC